MRTPIKWGKRTGGQGVTTMQKKGVLILNYLGQEIIDSMKFGIEDGVELNFLNQDGYWMFSTDTENDWAFMYDKKMDLNLIMHHQKLCYSTKGCWR